MQLNRRRDIRIVFTQRFRIALVSVVAALGLVGLTSVGLAAKAHLSQKDVLAIAESAAKQAGYSVAQSATIVAWPSINEFNWQGPLYDPTTQVWRVKFSKQGGPNHVDTFNVFVFDTTSHTEITCPGMEAIVSVMETNELPPDVRSFVPEGEQPEWLECADLNGDGVSDYVLVTEESSHLVRRTLQVLLRQSNGELKSVASNSHLVQIPAADGINGMPRVFVRKNRIVVVNSSAGSGGGDVLKFYFEYSPSESTWLLTRAEKSLVGYAHSDDDQAYVQRPGDFGHLTIADVQSKQFQ